MAEMALPTEFEPIVGLVEIGQMIEHAMYRRIRLNFYRLHCQLVGGNDKRASYDYFMLVCGPVLAKSQTLAADGALSIITEDGTLLGMLRYVSEPPIKSARPNRK
jgi:hypothetical protein